MYKMVEDEHPPLPSGISLVIILKRQFFSNLFLGFT